MSGTLVPPQPAATEVVIVGGGVVGVAVAWFLQKLGVPFVLCEKGRIAGEQSSRNWGWIRKQGRHPAELPLAIASLRHWAEIAAEIDGDIGFKVAGVTYLIESDADHARYTGWLEHARTFQLDSRLLSRAETNALLPDNRLGHDGSLYTPSDARAEPSLAVPAMAAALRARGACLFENCAVRGVELAGGRVSGVVTEHGPMRCNVVVAAGGVWTSLLLRRLGIVLPQLGVLASVLRTNAAPAICETAVGAKAFSLRRRADGGYTLARTNAATHRIGPASFRHLRAYLPVVRERWDKLKLRLGPDFVAEWRDERWSLDEESPFERRRVLDPAPDDRLLDEVLAAARAAYPQLGDARAEQRWGGCIDVLPDEIPALGPIPGVAGLLIATGLSGHGFGIGPGIGEVIAQLAAGRAPTSDLEAFRSDRFHA